MKKMLDGGGGGGGKIGNDDNVYECVENKWWKKKIKNKLHNK